MRTGQTGAINKLGYEHMYSKIRLFKRADMISVRGIILYDP